MRKLLNFRGLLENLKIKDGDLIYIHSSYFRMKKFGLCAEDIIDEIIKKIGVNGTVVFPSFSWNIEPTERPWKGYEKYFVSPIIFDVQHTKSNIGYLAEVFRNYCGTRRSAHPFWSICAFGPLAKTLIEKQELIEQPFGPLSSFALLKANNAKIVGLGVTLNTTSLCPLVDYDLGSYHFNNVITNYRVKSIVINSNRETIQCPTFTMRPEAVRYIQPSKVFEKCSKLRSKTTFLIYDNSYFFSYNFTDFYNSAIIMGRESIKSGRKVPWLEQLPIGCAGTE